jgi:two-component system, cell cycle response regulator
MRILIAEDDCVSRRVLESMLRNWGHTVVVTCDGNEAWQRLQEEDAPKLVILDWMMPGMDGIDVCRKVRNLQSEIRPHIILLSSLQQVKDLVKGINAGADDYITKPFEPEELKVRIQAGGRIIDLQMESLAAKLALRYQANHDPLTRIRNRASILEMMERDFDRAMRIGTPLSIALADIDHFKAINDTHGHQAGDAVLIEVAQRMAGEIRSYEGIGRYGGEEFLCVISDCDDMGASLFAERVRSSVAASGVHISGAILPVTISIGVASTCQFHNPTPEMLIRFADEAMYCAKRAGRNRVEIAAVTPDEAGKPSCSTRNST